MSSNFALLRHTASPNFRAGSVNDNVKHILGGSET
jgi:hypothetical protein